MNNYPRAKAAIDNERFVKLWNAWGRIEHRMNQALKSRRCTRKLKQELIHLRDQLKAYYRQSI